MRDDDQFFPKMLAISQCLCAEITVRELPAPCFCGIIPGASLIADYCDATNEGNGMAWVRLVGVSEAFQDQSPVSACNGPLEAIIEVGIVRCAIGVGDNGELPSYEDQLTATRLAAADMAAALAAIRCCLPNKKDVRVGGWVPLGPEGGCVGGAWTAVIQGG